MMTSHKLVGSYSNNIKVGIIGTTNVGKSALLNLLSHTKTCPASSSSFLFTTVDPNMTIFEVKDEKIDYIESVRRPLVCSRTKMTIIDTGGLIQGSFSEKNGVGTTSLLSLKNADVLIHLLRDFEDEQVNHYCGTVDPIRDLEMVRQETMLMDVHALEQALMEVETVIVDGVGGSQLQFEHETLVKAWNLIAGEERPVPPELAVGVNAKKKGVSKFRKPKIPKKCRGKELRYGDWNNSELSFLSQYGLLTAKEVLYLVNVSTRDYLRGRCPSNIMEKMSSTIPAEDFLLVSLAMEQNIERLSIPEQVEYHLANPTHISADSAIVAKCLDLLQLIRFYTISGNKEVKCWLLRRGSNLVDAAALVDLSISRAFLRADVASFEDFKASDGDRLKMVLSARLKSETRKYTVNDGDIITFYSLEASAGLYE